MSEIRPYCHGEPMQPSYRYMGTDGKIYRVFTCILCNRKEEVEVVQDEGDYFKSVRRQG